MDSKRSSKQVISSRFAEAGIAILHGDVLPSEACCIESCASLIREAASELAGEGYRKLLASHIEGRGPETLQFFESLGFQRRQEMYLFETDLRKREAPSSVAPPRGIAVLPFPHIRLEAIHEAIQKAFAENPVGLSTSEWEEYISDSTFLNSCSFFASAGTETVSILMARNEEPGVAHFAYLGTVPEWRRQGLGLLLTKNSLYAASKADFCRATALSGDPDNTAIIRLLEKVRFHYAYSKWNMRLDLRANR